MNLSSLSLRLFLLSLFSILLALIATTVALNDRFHAYFEGRVYAELQQHLEQLTTNVAILPDGSIIIRPLQDLRFQQPFAGLYWQSFEIGGDYQVSRSLWGGQFDTPQDTPPGTIFRTKSVSPIGGDLLVIGWSVLIGNEDQQRALVLAVASEAAEVTAVAAQFRNFLIAWLSIMFAGLMIAAWAQVRIGLAPLQNLKQRIERLGAAGSSRLKGDFPSEVQPLVDEINVLLSNHEKSVTSARAKSSDLAHGLKTPLTVMRALADDLAAEGNSKHAEQIEEQITSMHLFVERELARANVNATTAHPSPAKPTIEKILTGISKLPSDNELQWIMKIPDDFRSPFDEHELSELMGNILDNARKWARSQISITATVDDNGSRISISDDGPGISEEQRAAVLLRGEGLDKTKSGSGLGLTIAHDLAVQKNCEIRLETSTSGGLKVVIFWA